MSEHLHHKLSSLHQALLHGKMPRNFRWTDAVELVAHIGEVAQTAGGEFEFIVGTQREFFRRPNSSELGLEDVSRLRRLLKRAGSEPLSPPSVKACRMIVVIDHHAAHIYSGFDGDGSEGKIAIEPYDPHHFHHHLIHRKEAHYQGDRVPEEVSFFEEVAAVLLPFSEIVLIGHGTGKSSAVDALVAYMKKHRPEVFRRVMSIETTDLSGLTAPQAEAIARATWSKIPRISSRPTHLTELPPASTTRPLSIGD